MFAISFIKESLDINIIEKNRITTDEQEEEAVTGS